MSIECKNLHSSWNNFFNDNIKNILNEIENNIGKDYFPKKENILRFMESDLKNIKYIIVGMEPYPSYYIEDNIEIPVATGRSFEIANVTDWNQKFKQASLRNILKTIYFNETGNIISLENIRKEIENKNFNVYQPKDFFNELEKQGVLFLNATLTVKKGVVDTHTKYWKDFMNELIKYIEDNNENVSWILWGKPAQERFLPNIKNKSICTCHPRLAEFVNENCFKEMKDIKFTY